MRLILTLTASVIAVALSAAAAADVRTSHALSLIGEPKYPQGFEHLDFVNPDAPKGGTLRLHAVGGFDSLNPFIIRGEAAPGLALVFESLMSSTADDVSAEYGLIAESVEVPEDLSWVAFNLRPEARWHDGRPITVEDVIWSLGVLKEKGAPLYRFYYANVSHAEKLSDRKVKFNFTGPRNRELPQIMGQLTILPKHYWEGREFDRTTLEPPLGSGPYRVGTLEPNRSIALERVADYWGKDLPINRGRYNYDTLRYDMYRDSTVALEAFKANQYDYRMENAAKNWATAYDFPAVRNGQVVKLEFPHERPTGMQAFIYNTRRDKFADPKVRQALAYAFDFEWSNKNLFYDQYQRATSYFSNSELAAEGLPSPEELKLLEPFRDRLPAEVFTRPYEPPRSDGSGLPRENLRTATRLLGEAGWTIKNGQLAGPNGQPMEIEFLLVQPDFERVVSPFIRNLERLGVKAGIRTVDSAQYQNRIRDFDFDIIVGGWAQSESPGNEQRDMWSAAAAERPGSTNYAGIRSPVVDALVEAVVAAPDRASLITATRALDRVLLWNHFVIPQYHLTYDRIAYWNKFGRPGKDPKYSVDLFAWWVDPAARN